MYYVGSIPVMEYDIKQLMHSYSTIDLSKLCYLGYTPDDIYALRHFGIKGMKWGLRRFQNEDGTLTREGINRYREYRDGNRSGGIGRRLANFAFGKSVDAGGMARNARRSFGNFVQSRRENSASKGLLKSLMDTARGNKEGHFESVDIAKRYNKWMDDKAKIGLFSEGLADFAKNFSKMTTADLDRAFDKRKRDKEFESILGGVGKTTMRDIGESGRMRSTVGRGMSFVNGLFKNSVNSELHRNKMTVDRSDRQWDDPRYSRFRMGYAW